LDATDGNLQPVTSPAPLYLLDDYAKVSIKEVQDFSLILLHLRK